MVKANDEIIDGNFLRLVALNLQMAQSLEASDGMCRSWRCAEAAGTHVPRAGPTEHAARCWRLLRAEPTREKLLDLLIQAPDERSREILVTFGRLDARLRLLPEADGTDRRRSDEEEKQRLSDLRKEVLEVRDRIDAEARADVRSAQRNCCGICC